jgi:hypothetical protein
MSDAMDKMVTAACTALPNFGHPNGYVTVEDIEEVLTAALAAAPTVEGYVLCEGHHVAPTGHCYRHGNRFCGKPDCGPCPGPFQDLIARPRTGGTP